MDSPAVLFLVFNRVEQTRQVFHRIREARPSRLFVAADGPRANRPGEDSMCRKTRELIDEGIDWDCEVHRLYRSANLGCRASVSQAITWFFGEVEEGIVLEDDCLPDRSFFPYCAELLSRYRTDTRVFHVAGFNPISRKPRRSDPSYSCWHFGSIWGWASWRRAWAHYDVAMTAWPQFVRDERMRSYCTSDAEAVERTRSFAEVHDGRIDTWDFQWAFTRLLHNGLSLTPSTNLITNIGFGELATHTTDSADPRAGTSTAAIRFPLRHPDRITASTAFGEDYWMGIRGIRPVGPLRRVCRALKRRLGWLRTTT